MPDHETDLCETCAGTGDSGEHEIESSPCHVCNGSGRSLCEPGCVVGKPHYGECPKEPDPIPQSALQVCDYCDGEQGKHHVDCSLWPHNGGPGFDNPQPALPTCPVCGKAVENDDPYHKTSEGTYHWHCRFDRPEPELCTCVPGFIEEYGQHGYGCPERPGADTISGHPQSELQTCGRTQYDDPELCGLARGVNCAIHGTALPGTEPPDPLIPSEKHYQYGRKDERDSIVEFLRKKAASDICDWHSPQLADFFEKGGHLK